MPGIPFPPDRGSLVRNTETGSHFVAPTDDAAAVSRGPRPTDGTVGVADTEASRYVVLSKPTLVVIASKAMEQGNWQLNRGAKGQ